MWIPYRGTGVGASAVRGISYIGRRTSTTDVTPFGSHLRPGAERPPAGEVAGGRGPGDQSAVSIRAEIAWPLTVAVHAPPSGLVMPCARSSAFRSLEVMRTFIW